MSSLFFIQFILIWTLIRVFIGLGGVEMRWIYFCVSCAILDWRDDYFSIANKWCHWRWNISPRWPQYLELKIYLYCESNRSWQTTIAVVFPLCGGNYLTSDVGRSALYTHGRCFIDKQDTSPARSSLSPAYQNYRSFFAGRYRTFCLLSIWHLIFCPSIIVQPLSLSLTVLLFFDDDSFSSTNLLPVAM